LGAAVRTRVGQVPAERFLCVASPSLGEEHFGLGRGEVRADLGNVGANLFELRVGTVEADGHL
jgi:hypothetical protein